MTHIQTSAVISKDSFPKIEEIEKAFAEGRKIDGEKGFLIGHDNLIDITKKVLEAVSSSEKEIPREVAALLRQEIWHFLNADNIVLEQYHGGRRRELTEIASNSLDLILTASNSGSRVTAANLGLQAISAHRALLDL